MNLYVQSQIKKMFFGVLRIRKTQEAADPTLKTNRIAVTNIVYDFVKTKMSLAMKRVRKWVVHICKWCFFCTYIYSVVLFLVKICLTLWLILRLKSCQMNKWIGWTFPSWSILRVCLMSLLNSICRWSWNFNSAGCIDRTSCMDSSECQW